MEICYAKGVRVISSRVIATSFALIAFAAAMIVGLLAGNAFQTVLLRALAVTLACYAIGRIVGAVAQSTMQREIDAHEKRFPLPDNASESSANGARRM